MGRAHGARAGAAASALGVTAAAVLVILVSVSPPSGPIGRVLEPNASGSSTYLLSGRGGLVDLSFPDCASVRVVWEVLVGGSTALGVFPPAEISPTDCHGPPPSNATWPSTWPNVAIDAGPVCLEVGTQGQCTFTADRAGYSLLLYSPAPYAPGWPNLGNESVSATVMYTSPGWGGF